MKDDHNWSCITGNSTVNGSTGEFVCDNCNFFKTIRYDENDNPIKTIYWSNRWVKIVKFVSCKKRMNEMLMEDILK